MTNQYLPCVLRSYTDSSFTNPHQVVLPDEPLDFSGRFTHMGAQYWGVETERHQAFVTNEEQACFFFDSDSHHELCIELVEPSLVREIRISTRWYIGNHVPNVSVELILPDKTTTTVLERVALKSDEEHVFGVEATRSIGCYVRCYHEGGIARINLLGEPLDSIDERPNLLTSAAISHVSDEQYGRPSQAVGGSRQEDHMIGWESARMGFGDQAVFHLEAPATLEELVVDTYLHRLNPPLSCHLFGLPATLSADFDRQVTNLPRWALTGSDGTQIVPEDFHAYMTQRVYLEELDERFKPLKIQLLTLDACRWVPLLPFARLYADRLHRFTDLLTHDPVSHLLYLHFPSGGIHGLRAHGKTAVF